MYSQKIIEHSKVPQNQGKLEEADIKQPGANPLCGDSLMLYLKTKDGVVEKAMFEGEGCAISQAAASIMTEELIGKTAEDIEKLTTDDMLKLLELDTLTPARTKCATLALDTAKVGMK